MTGCDEDRSGWGEGCVRARSDAVGGTCCSAAPCVAGAVVELGVGDEEFAAARQTEYSRARRAGTGRVSLMVGGWRFACESLGTKSLE